MGRKAYNYSLNELSWDKIAKTTVDVYKECILDKERISNA